MRKQKPVSPVSVAWFLFVFILCVLFVSVKALASEKVEIECNETHCLLTHEQIDTIIKYVKRLEKMKGKTCA